MGDVDLPAEYDLRIRVRGRENDHEGIALTIYLADVDEVVAVHVERHTGGIEALGPEPPAQRWQGWH